MTQSEVINKLSMEMALALGELDHLQTCRTYIQMALSIGIEHYTKDMEEIVQMDSFGNELGRFKSVTEAAERTGIHQSYISAVLIGQQHTTGGFIFMKAKDKELVPARKTA